MDTATIEAGTTAIQKLGFATVVAIALLAAFFYFNYVNLQQTEAQNANWHSIRNEDMAELRQGLEVERQFIRGKLTETIEHNTEGFREQADALRVQSEALKDLTVEIQRRNQ